MSESSESLAKFVPEIDFDIGIDKDDIVAIAVSNHETQLLDAKRKLALNIQEDIDSHFYFGR